MSGEAKVKATGPDVGFGARGNVDDLDAGELVGAIDFGEQAACRGLEIRVGRTRNRGTQMVIVRQMRDGKRFTTRVFGAGVSAFVAHVLKAADRIAELRGEP